MSLILDGSSGITYPIGSGTQGAQSKVLQVVQATYSTEVTTSSSSFVTTNLTTSITPLFSTSKILVIVNLAAVFQNSLATNIGLTIYRNSTNLSPAGTSVLTGFGTLRSDFPTLQANQTMTYLDSPATTSSTSYTAYFASYNGNSIAINHNGAVSVITLMEIAA